MGYEGVRSISNNALLFGYYAYNLHPFRNKRKSKIRLHKAPHILKHSIMRHFFHLDSGHQNLLPHHKDLARAGALHIGEEALPGVGGQDAVFARLQGDQGVAQDIGACGKVVCRPADLFIADLRLGEEPPAPAICKGIVGS